MKGTFCQAKGTTEIMQEFRKALTNLPWIAKLLLVVFYDLYGSLKRISKGDTKLACSCLLRVTSSALCGSLTL